MIAGCCAFVLAAPPSSRPPTPATPQGVILLWCRFAGAGDPHSAKITQVARSVEDDPYEATPRPRAAPHRGTAPLLRSLRSSGSARTAPLRGTALLLRLAAVVPLGPRARSGRSGSWRRRGHVLRVMVVPVMVKGMGARGAGAGPPTTEPSLIEYWLPWQGQLMVPFATEATVQPMCVQTAVNALN